MDQFEKLLDYNLFQEDPRNNMKYETSICNTKWVSESVPIPIVEEEVLGIIPTNHYYPILISAPTGRGKSSFVLNELAENARKRNRKMVVLSNRIALSIQQKREHCEKQGRLPMATAQLKERFFFGNIAILTYQSVLKNLSAIIDFCGEKAPIYIVFDEAHFFCEDSTFNVETDTILKNLADLFPASVRIYMTATPEKIKPVIAAFERLYFIQERNPLLNEVIRWKPREKRVIKEYYFEPDFHNVSLHFFHNWDTIIKKTGEEQDTSKWLIFVNSKDEGKYLHEEIGKKCAAYVDADSAQKSETFQMIINTERFSERVLISTSVLDNGVNIRDDELTHIVVDFSDQTHLIQMLGRKRRRPEETVDLYVKVPELKQVQGYSKQKQYYIDLLQQMRWNPYSYLQENWGNLSTAEQKLMRVSFQGTIYGPIANLHTNLFAKYQLYVEAGWYEDLAYKMSHDDYAYEKEVCKWLRKTFSPTMLENETILEIDTNEKSDDEHLKQCRNEIQELLEGILTKGNDEDEIVLQKEDIQKIDAQIFKIVKKNKVKQKDVELINDTNQGRWGSNISHAIKNLQLPFELSGSGNKKRTLRRKNAENGV